jgi:Tol biopolymer transport system component
MSGGLRALVGLAAAISWLVAAERAAEASFPGGNGLLAYSRFSPSPGSQSTIWLVDPRSGRERQLTRMPRRCSGPDPLWDDVDPSFSPSGRFVVYAHSDTCDPRTADGGYVIRADGRNRRRIPIPAGELAFPGFSPSGNLLAYEGGFDEVFITSVERTARERELRLARSGYSLGDPAWGASARLALTLGGGGNIWGHIATVSPHGKDLRLVTRSARDSMPSWSPTADRIVFARAKENPLTDTIPYRSDILVAAARTPRPVRPKRLTRTRDAFNPTWSPDRRSIAYVRDLPSESFLAIMRARDGAGQQLITNNVHPDSRISWQPRPRR